MQKVEDGINLSKLTDTGKEGRFIGSRIQAWLDKEWIQQPIHGTIGNIVGQNYILYREKGVEDLGEMMMNIGGVLERTDMGDAFVNAWDVANRVGDLVIMMLDRESCDCAGDLKADYEAAIALGIVPSDVEEAKQKARMLTPLEYQDVIRKFSSDFTRYKFLKDFLEDDTDWFELQPLLTILFGWRLNEAKQQLEHHPELAPVGWEQLGASCPDLSNPSNKQIKAKLEGDLPEDEEAAELLLEALMGSEWLKFAKNKPVSDDLKQRMLVIKWLSAQGITHNEFPLTAKFIPGHMRDDDPFGDIDDDSNNKNKNNYQ